MNAVFTDTSAIVALLNAKDENYARANRTFMRLRTRQAPLLATSYVLVETYALVGRRLGLDAVSSFQADFAPLLDIVWIDEALHNAGLDLLLERRKRQLSLVDSVSFIVMGRRNVEEAFAYDPHFEQEGFSLIN